MINLTSIEAQLAKAGCKMNSWGRSEVKELCHILTPDEVIAKAANGYYAGGFALLVATNMRLILVDRKPMFLTLDAISYGTIQEVQLNYRLMNSSIYVYTSNKVLVFTSWSHKRLRDILDFTQAKVMEQRIAVSQMSQQFVSDEPDLTKLPSLPLPNPQNDSPLILKRKAGFVSPTAPINYNQPSLPRR